jgi:mono/diheme cytochrome c family protein
MQATSIQSVALALSAMLGSGLLLQGQERVQPGVTLTFTPARGEATSSDTIIAPNVWLHVAQGHAPTPFLAPGPYTAIWHGYLSVELRSIYAFQAEANGALRVEVNAREVLNMTGEGEMSEPGVRVRLNKGTNAVRVFYTPAQSGDAHVRLFWTARDSYPQLIPQSAWTCIPDEAAQACLRRHRGRELVIEYRCARCHTMTGQGIPELTMNAPVFAGLASRRRPAWLRDWLANPAAMRANQRMPEMFHAGEAIDASEAVAAFLATLTDPTWRSRPEPTETESIAAGKKLFGELHCVACHNAPATSDPEPDKISFDHVADKFAPGALARFLREPTEHFGSIRMPDFRLSEAESGQIAAFLLSVAGVHDNRTPRPELAPEGRNLVQSTGCLNCHSLDLENQFKTREITDLAEWDGGCLSRSPLAGTHVPFFGFPDADRRAIREFAAGGFDSLARNVDADFAARQVTVLNCAGCHNRQIDLVPPLNVLGGKIKPEYGTEIIAGRVSEKPRPWIRARMPGFPTRAEGIARGLANIHGFPSKTPPESQPIDEELAKVGFKLVQPDGGFSCISCHAIGKAAATQVFESAGINFAWTTQRLQHDYFVRWLRNPLSIDPSTKMPVFFDESGHSPLAVLQGDTVQQIDALWNYFREGRQMQIPPGMGAAPAKQSAVHKLE